MSTMDTLTTALQSGKCVEFEYDHQPRTVEIHAIGQTRTGKTCFRGYQVGGGSLSGAEEGWKLFSVNRISEPTITEAVSMAPREGYTQGDSAFAEISAQV